AGAQRGLVAPVPGGGASVEAGPPVPPQWIPAGHAEAGPRPWTEWPHPVQKGAPSPMSIPVSLVLSAALTASPPPRTDPAERQITADLIRAHVRFLASDLLEGRSPATRGDALAESYIAAQLESLGVRPAGTEGFLQPFEIVGVDGHAPQVRFSRGEQSLHPPHPDHA